MASNNTTPKSKNRDWGFYGTIDHHGDPEIAWIAHHACDRSGAYEGAPPTGSLGGGRPGQLGEDLAAARPSGPHVRRRVRLAS